MYFKINIEEYNFFLKKNWTPRLELRRADKVNRKEKKITY